VVDHETISVWLVAAESKPAQIMGSLLELKLDKQVNQHTQVCLKMRLSSRNDGIDADTKIALKQQDEVIFRGSIVTYKISAQSQYWELELEAASATCELDLEVKRRTFQNEKMTYADLVKTMLAEYPGADCIIDRETGNKPIGGFYLQFDETDWQHLLRLASALNLALIPDPTAENPRFYFGIPPASNNANPKPKTVAYHLFKNTDIYRYHTENDTVVQPAETDYEIFKVEERGDFLNIGDPVKYHDNRLVYRVTVTMVGSELIQECWLAPQGGFKQPRIYNAALRGLTIKGTIVARSTGQDNVPPVAVKVWFTIDKVYKNHHPKNKTENRVYHWFPYAPFYAAEGSTGLYCLPEVGEQVALYFPGCKEEDAFVTNSYRFPDQVKITNPNIKCLRTAFGKKIVFDEHGIKIVGKEGTNDGKDFVYIELESDGNLTVYSDSKISFQAAQTLNAHAKGKVDLTADDHLYLTSNGCSISMTGGNDFKGLKVPQKQGKAGKKATTKKKRKTSNGGGMVVGGNKVNPNVIEKQDSKTENQNNDKKQKGDLIKETTKIINENEGNYGSVNPKDGKGTEKCPYSLSVGKIQWYATRAHDLLRKIKEKNSAQAKKILSGTTLYAELEKDHSVFRSRPLTMFEKSVVSKLLVTKEGKAAQDETIAADVPAYIQHGRRLGISSEKTLAYYADLENQGGYGGARRVVQAAGGGKSLSLDKIHKAAINDSILGKYSDRRNTTYQKSNSYIYWE
jgi:hypothetical protein